MHELRSLIRDVADFPKAGVTFKDITPLLAHADGMRCCVESLAAPWRESGIQAVCGIEARGFIFGAALAQSLGAGFVPLRKPGKLPAATVGVDFALEYGQDRLEVHTDAVRPGERVLLVDDVLATGGTLAAAVELMDRLDADLCGAAVVIELASLHGRANWHCAAPLHALVCYD
ncbi:adenine phosphoribosyltransferase [Oleiagrimonas sp.]|jgi:adenine phosphoribosyltransferase|uniref:adenine phosphoribosyltransferase n=1 Tax=Oleiagrimonas sp. TaxID=2010330 RepID=UPI00261ADD20|nr:adenine phosphoribosyltransferase [Oleiagrimonas sp.]MDA3914083.1 adenine phosphoribosyltransferase [Oleiagrimonas sp.]